MKKQREAKSSMAHWSKKRRQNYVSRGLAVAAMLAMSGVMLAQGSAAAIPQLVPKQFVGSWFELAHLPDKKEKACIADALTLFTLVDKPFRFAQVDSCRLKDGTTDARNYTGTTRIKKTWTGQLKVWTVWPLSRKLWVLAAGPDYEWLLVGAPNHKTLAVLSRTTKLDSDEMAQITTQAAAQGFAVAKLVTVPQTSRTAPAPAPTAPAQTPPANAPATPE